MPKRVAPGVVGAYFDKATFRAEEGRNTHRCGGGVGRGRWGFRFVQVGVFATAVAANQPRPPELQLPAEP